MNSQIAIAYYINAILAHICRKSHKLWWTNWTRILTRFNSVWSHCLLHLNKNRNRDAEKLPIIKCERKTWPWAIIMLIPERSDEYFVPFHHFTVKVVTDVRALISNFTGFRIKCITDCVPLSQLRRLAARST